ncbi:hypothetical protein BKA80DRAFT_265976 [Phyllosticta citrichinensis]
MVLKCRSFYPCLHMAVFSHLLLCLVFGWVPRAAEADSAAASRQTGYNAMRFCVSHSRSRRATGVAVRSQSRLSTARSRMWVGGIQTRLS